MSDICGSQAAARSMQQLAREFSACRDMLVALGNENRQLVRGVARAPRRRARRQSCQACAALAPRDFASSQGSAGRRPCGSLSAGNEELLHASARLDRWAQLARVTAHAEQFVRLVQELDARAEAGKHACSESRRPAFPYHRQPRCREPFSRCRALHRDALCHEIPRFDALRRRRVLLRGLIPCHGALLRGLIPCYGLIPSPHSTISRREPV